MNWNWKPALAVAAACAGVAGVIVAPAAAGAAKPADPPVVYAHLGKHTTLSKTHLRAGLITFVVRSGKGDHTLQIARLHHGYSLAEANSDIGKGFRGDASAIRRVDRNVTFSGGADAKPGKRGRFTTSLHAGNFVAVNFDTGAYANIIVHGSPARRAKPHTSSRITMLTYGFDLSSSTLPRSGTTNLGNVSDQPHFIVMQRVKRGTTHKQVQRAFNHESNSKPNFVLPGSTDSGVLTQNKTIQFRYRLPAGRYVIACFWPDDHTGMLHAQMGMFKLITLK